MHAHLVAGGTLVNLHLPYGLLPGGCSAFDCGSDEAGSPPWPPGPPPPRAFVSEGNSDRSSRGGVPVSAVPLSNTLWKLLMLFPL